jgi:hypothetical protein
MLKTRTVTLPELGMIAGTRAALGAGVALLFGDRLAPAQRRAVGWTLLAVGAFTTIPLVAGLISRGRDASGHLEGSRPGEHGTSEFAMESP